MKQLRIAKRVNRQRALTSSCHMNDETQKLAQCGRGRTVHAD
jgi:hypothetical protein